MQRREVLDAKSQNDAMIDNGATRTGDSLAC